MPNLQLHRFMASMKPRRFSKGDGYKKLSRTYREWRPIAVRRNEPAITGIPRLPNERIAARELFRCASSSNAVIGCVASHCRKSSRLFVTQFFEV